MAIQQKLYTVDDVWEMVHQPEHIAKKFELIEGRLIEMSRPGGVHGLLAARFSRHLGNFVEPAHIGIITVETGYHPPNDRHNLFSPDVAFISVERAPNPFPAQFVPVMPDLAIEIKAPNDTKRDMRRKAELYLEFGTRMVWLVFPDDQEIEVYVPDQDVITYKIDGVLDGATVLPGFTLAVREVFA
jgi:Uma2 family endonuclease